MTRRWRVRAASDQEGVEPSRVESRQARQNKKGCLMHPFLFFSMNEGSSNKRASALGRLPRIRCFFTFSAICVCIASGNAYRRGTEKQSGGLFRPPTTKANLYSAHHSRRFLRFPQEIAAPISAAKQKKAGRSRRGGLRKRPRESNPAGKKHCFFQ